MRKFLFLISSVVFLLAFFTKEILAADVLDLKVFPPVAYLSVKPGAGINHPIKINNSGIYTLEITPVLVNFHGDEKTGLVILEQKSDFVYLNLEGDPNKWGKSFLLKPGEEKTLNFVIALPHDAEYKEHYLSILFQAKQLSYSSISNKDTVISAVVASNLVLLVNADDQNRGQLNIEQFSLPKIADSFMGFSFSALVKNIGTNAMPVDGYIKVSHWPNQNVETYQLYPDMVLAGSKRSVRAMTEEDLKTLEKMEENKEVTIATGKDYEAAKTEFISKKLRDKFLYKKGFLIGAYDLELKVGDDILQKRIVVLPFSILLIAVFLPFLYWVFISLNKLFKKPTVD